MKTNVKATNWPAREVAREITPASSRKGQKVTRKNYDARRLAAVAGKLDQLLANAQRKFAHLAQAARTDAHCAAADRASDKIVDALHTRAVALLKAAQ